MSTTLRLGSFIVLTLLILASGLFLIGSTRWWFKPTYQVKAEFQNVAGLSAGGEVRVGGLHEGTVRSIEMPRQADGKITVLMDLAESTRDVVKQDSVASIRAEGLVGDRYVDITFGSPQAAALKSGDTIASEPPAEFAQLLKKTDQLLDTAKDALRSVGATSDNLQSITAKIDQGKGSAGALINDKTVYQQVSAGAASFRDNMDALKHNFLLRGFFSRRGYEDSEQLTKNEIPHLPAENPSRKFVYSAKQLFDKPDATKLKHQSVLKEAGRYLENDKFSLAVVAASGEPKGDSDQQHTLTEAQAFVVREYLADNFRLDDTRIKTIGLGKSSPNAGSEADQVEILVYSRGVKVPAAPTASASGR